MTLQGDLRAPRDYAAYVGNIWRAARRREGLGTIVAVVVISALLIVGLSYVLEQPSPTDNAPETPPAADRTQ
jgi:hypothetical protein